MPPKRRIRRSSGRRACWNERSKYGTTCSDLGPWPRSAPGGSRPAAGRRLARARCRRPRQAPAAATPAARDRRGPCRRTWSSRLRATPRAPRARPAIAPRRVRRPVAWTRTNRERSGSRRRRTGGRTRGDLQRGPRASIETLAHDSGAVRLVCRARSRWLSTPARVARQRQAARTVGSLDRGQRQQSAPVLRTVRRDAAAGEQASAGVPTARGSCRSRAPRLPRAAPRRGSARSARPGSPPPPRFGCGRP